MPITYKYDPTQGLIAITAAGDIRLPEIASFLREVQKEPWFPAPSLTDTRESLSLIPSDEVRAIASMLRTLAPRMRDTRVGVLVNSDVSFGLVRMLGLLLDDAIDLRPFRDRALALEWLIGSEGGGS